MGRVDIAYFTAMSRWLNAKKKISFADELRVVYLPEKYSEHYYDIFSKKPGTDIFNRYQEAIKTTVNLEDAQRYVINNPIR